MKKDCTIDETLPLGVNFSMLTKSYYGAFTRFMEENHELERYYTILLMIDDASEKCTQQCICDRMMMDKVSMVRILDHLDEKGYIRRVTNPEDRRQRWVELTAKAIRELPMIRKSVETMNRKALKGFSKTETAQLYEMMRRIYQNTRQLPSHPVTVKFSKNTARK